MAYTITLNFHITSISSSQIVYPTQLSNVRVHKVLLSTVWVDFKLYSEKNSVISKNFGKILSRPHIGLAEISTKSIYSIEIVYNICTVYSIGYSVYHIPSI